MKLKSLVFAVLFLTSMLFTVAPAMAKINPPPQTDPIVLAQELKNAVNGADGQLFRGFTITYTEQLRAALIKKIDDVIRMFEKGNYMGGCRKLEGDIAPKLWICETNREQARSWLSDYPEMRDAVEVFRDYCQDLIGQILELADPRPTP